MYARAIRMTLVAGMTLLATACATSQDWQEWRSHNTHFASGEHGFFSMRNNKDGSKPQVYRSDIVDAGKQSWWGVYTVSVSPNQIFQN